ncbi:bacterial membrane protein YfhO [Longilinea arvoryzae]|uniref:Bacterial membrane protein YfhO n=1 Tax=Longilinea arvoryzae TaxID=360412 RepID=A0A0S7BLD1_9CHLR|nr:YfhO family protein [Longilinea arvoryzae]GAP14737.1 bacterial membrane protein YfhO [Longilinea arvoryzae]
MKKSWKYLILLVIPLAFLVYLRGDFAFPVRGDYSDLVISHLPNAEFLRRNLLDGELPLWSPLLFGGYPFAANPLSGLHYPPGWLALLFPLPLGFNLVTALHMILAGLGMYLFLRQNGLSDWPALTAGVVFQAMPKLMAHFAAGHLTLTYAVCLTPWVLWAEFKRIEHRGSMIWTIAPGIALALLALADIRWAPYAAILWLFYSLREFFRQRSSPKARKFIVWLGGAILQGLVVGVLTAPLWLPLLELVPLTTRAEMTAGERVGISLPAANLLGVFVPSMGSYAEWELYAGALPWLVLIFTLAVPDLRRRVWFWLAVLALSLAASLGEVVPGYAFISGLPGFSLLRVPARALFLCGFSFAVLTGYALEYLSQTKVEQKPEPVFFMVPFVAFPLLIAAGMGLYLGGYYEPFLWAGVALLFGFLAILAAEKRWLRVEISQCVFLLLIIIEMGGMDASIMTRKKPADVYGPFADLLQVVAPKSGDLYRVYSPSFSLPQYIAVQQNLDLVDGIDPMQLRSYVKLFSAASGIPIHSYSVTLPPFTGGDPQKDNAAYSPNAKLLGVLNTKYVLSAFPLSTAGLKWVQVVNGIQVYENSDYRERAWVESDSGGVRSVEILDYTANRVSLQAQGPGTLVLSDVVYPGWQARVDGQSTDIQPYQGALRSVRLNGGLHQIEFVFHPISVYLGWGLALTGWIMIGVLSLKQRRMNAGSRE